MEDLKNPLWSNNKKIYYVLIFSSLQNGRGQHIISFKKKGWSTSLLFDAILNAFDLGNFLTFQVKKSSTILCWLLAGWHICTFDNSDRFTCRITSLVVNHMVGYFIHAENASLFRRLQALRRKVLFKNGADKWNVAM